ncbi:MAG: hypothetical protein CO030_03865 [Candidatus Magasanikbacteria bacterium CG_4_9_14_0_2_um_filter_42_11]|uniref:Uncharacterized protein n=1 Tax=Candidatus Magasanikbacteria bacterium CG_4_9_14_0_2_um_filter_42_11 TaxID=1974643 RepID=A0A2M8F991_9BACT|nr:MAG: hypothetical protein COU34_03570 [Candidatus Magasanikbacteria bacterium CG10_big_fil_rev_8_21_14_0_10_43_9]PIY92377.1 MAG: hypothetical protein COY70_03495 [Candidatus Magasanikbacteria bacterium CG_4_10_14_0_8_um_filter_42_12]PJC52229.1 MAG: hypothetical protein CO030_03865 [Candidatus Magasanikbacteria bacterium CG_4_9_14_0_2_um_filter_42_11]
MVIRVGYSLIDVNIGGHRVKTREFWLNVSAPPMPGHDVILRLRDEETTCVHGQVCHSTQDPCLDVWHVEVNVLQDPDESERLCEMAEQFGVLNETCPPSKG